MAQQVESATKAREHTVEGEPAPTNCHTCTHTHKNKLVNIFFKKEKNPKIHQTGSKAQWKEERNLVDLKMEEQKLTLWMKVNIKKH